MKKTTPQERYDAANCRRINLKLNKKIDADVLEWLEAQPSMQGAIKDLIRAEIKKKVKNFRRIRK